ncbi:MAG: hypothetical protein JST16_07635 [Bdellovibrionales bacterium]|nr:hypothetical protein [Bdellovibrionales bacterium]
MLKLAWLCLMVALPIGAQTLRAGAYAADITPEQWPVRIIGGFVQPLATKAHDPLHARALVLDDGKTKLAFVVVDSCYLPRALFDRAKIRALGATGIPPSNMMMAATHAHSAPPSKPEGASEVELAYQKLLEERIAKAVAEADRRLAPAQIGWLVRQEPDELHNRRWFMKQGSIPPNPFGETGDQVRMNPPSGSPDLIKPAGPTDPGFSVVCIKSAGGQPIAVLANYSLHYVGGIANNELSADYFGEFANQIASRLNAGPEFVGILSNGTSGDVNNIDFQHPSPRRKPFEKIRIVAGKLADSALAAYRDAKYQSSLTLAASESELPLRYRKPTPAQVDKARTYLAAADEKLLPMRAKPYAERTLRLAQGPEWADVKLQAFRVGGLGVAAIPFEVFTQIGLDIKEKSPFRPTFTMELANGHYGYLPTPEQHQLGGYETWMGTNLVEKEASRKITSTILDLLKVLSASNGR